MCCTSQHYEGTSSKRNQQSNPQDDLAVINDQLVGGAEENSRNPSRMTKQQRAILNDYFNNEDVLCGQDESSQFLSSQMSTRHSLNPSPKHSLNYSFS